MENNCDGSAWVFDSLVGFLHGPVWNVPLQTFIEEKSLPFEPTDDGEVLDRPEYKKIHDEYRNLVQLFNLHNGLSVALATRKQSFRALAMIYPQRNSVRTGGTRKIVDVMLGSFMEDIGITADQFEAACTLSARDLAGLPAHFHRRLFEQIWAANDYDMFVKMMTHKNVELQLQALELIERRFGTMPNLFATEPEDLNSSRSDDSEGWPDSDDVMSEIKKLQELEIEEPVTVPPAEVVAEKKTLLSKLHSFEKKDDNAEKAVFSDPYQSTDDKGERRAKIVIEPPTPPPKKVEVSDEEMRARQEYLKQQRDKLLALKKQVREKRLGVAEPEEEVCAGGEGSFNKVSRPKSARVAQAALAGKAPAPPPDALQLRRALASKLKTEVVGTSL